MVKYGATSSAHLFALLESSVREIFTRAPDALVPLIAESCRIKAQVVAEAEREAGPRRVLNFGHTSAHAIEAITKYRRVRHGEAVAYGMLVAAEVAVGRDPAATVMRDRLRALVRTLGPLPAIGDLNAKEVVAIARRDKKVVEGRLHFVLATDIGAWKIVDDVSEDELRDGLLRVGFKT